MKRYRKIIKFYYLNMCSLSRTVCKTKVYVYHPVRNCESTTLKMLTAKPFRYGITTKFSNVVEKCSFFVWNVQRQPMEVPFNRVVINYYSSHFIAFFYIAKGYTYVYTIHTRTYKRVYSDSYFVILFVLWSI